MVIPRKGSKGKSYAEYQAEKTGTSWKGKLKIAVDALIPQVSSFEELLSQLQAAGYRADHERTIILHEAAAKALQMVGIGADEDSRALRIHHDYKEHVADLTVGMRRVDHKRIAYYERYADTVWCDPQHYHLCLDSGVLGIEVCADMIVFAVQSLYNNGGICL